MRKMKKKSIHNPNDYEYKAVELCYKKGCVNEAEWWIDDIYALCDECYRELERCVESEEEERRCLEFEEGGK